jgi:hypothetical protein
MKKLSTKIAMFGLLLVTVFVNGCASTTDTVTGKPALNLGPDFGMPAPGKSKVIFLRPGHFAYAVHFGVHDGERLIGESSSSEYFAYECDPGHHIFSTSMDNLCFLDADLLPDRIYYVEVQATMGMWIAGVRMNALYPGCPEVNWQKMPRIISKLEKTTITSNDVGRDKKNIEGYMKRLKEYQDKSKDEGKILPEYGQTVPLTSQ